MHTKIQPLFEFFKRPLSISNISLQNIQSSFLLFNPESNGSKISDFDAVQSKCEVLFRICNKGNLNSIKSLNEVMQKSESVKNILPLSNILCHLAFTAPVTVASNEKTFSKLKLIKNYLRSTTCKERLNFLMILNAEKDILDNLNILQISEQWATLNNVELKYNLLLFI